MGVRTTICGGLAGRLATCLAFALAVFGSLIAVSPPSATAGLYTVNACTPPPSAGTGDEFLLEIDPGTTGFGVSKTCGAGLSRIEQTARGAEAIGGSRWSLRAPEGTVIRALTGFRELTPWENSDIIWELRSDDAGRLDRISTSTPGGAVGYAVNSDLVFAGLVCARRPCLPRPGNTLSTSISLKNLVATLEDEVAPGVVIDPSRPVPATVRGTIEIPFVANDVGGGLAGAFLFVDGEIVASTVDRNDGKCTFPFRFVAPCKRDLRSSIPLDTTALSEGRHEVKVEVEDVGELTAESETISIDVHNTPDPVPPSPGPGPSPGAGPPPNANPRMVDRTAPALRRASLTRKRFIVGKARTALAAAAKATGGTVLRFASSEAGTLSIAIAKAKKGAKPIATLRRSISAGAGRVPLSGRIGKKPLRPGRYRLTLSARDAAGNISAPVVLPFTVLPPVS